MVVWPKIPGWTQIVALNVQQKRAPCFVPDATRFSRWSTLVGACARMLKCARVMRKTQCAGDLTEADRHIGEVEIFRDIQRPIFQDSQYSNFLAPLTPFLDESSVPNKELHEPTTHLSTHVVL